MLSPFDLLVVGLSLCGICYLGSKRNKLPPGPWNIPFVSGLSAIQGPPWIVFQQWAQQYGPLIRTKFGLLDALIIDDPKLMREAFNNPVFSGRMNHKAFTLFSGGKRGILNADGEEWNEQRRFAIRTLRDFGFGKRSMETLIVEEIQEFLKWMKDNEGLATEMKMRLVLATVSTLWKLIAGERQDQSDDILKDIVDKANQCFNEAARANGIWVSIPQVTDLFPKIFLKDFYRLQDQTRPFIQIFQDAIDLHKKNPVCPSQPRDLIDVYLHEVDRTTDPKSSFYGQRGVETMRTVIGDLYGAGQGTTSILLAWSVIYLVTYPEVQKRFQAELDTVIGPNRQPSLDDRPNLPYTEAMTLEIHRFASQLPLAIFHQTMDHTRLGGYDIPKGTVVIPNLWSMNMSRKIYGDPENFRPDRFLSPDGMKVMKSEDLMPFGTGKRQCLGETLGRDSFFLFITSIFQRFEIKSLPGQDPPTMEPAPGFFREPETFSVIFQERSL